MPKRKNESAEQLSNATSHEHGTDAENTAQKPRVRLAANRAKTAHKAGTQRGEDAGEAVASAYAAAVQAVQSPSPIVYRQVPAADASTGNVAALWRLPHYERDGKTDRESRMFAGEVMESPDWLRQAEAMYGSGYYIKVPRLPGGKFGREMFVYVPPMSEPFVEPEDSFTDALDEADVFEDVPSEPMMTRREWQRERELIQLKAEFEAMKRYGVQANAAQRPKSMLEQTLEEIAAQRIREVLTAPNPAPVPSQAESLKRSGATLTETVLMSLLNNPNTSPDVAERIAIAAVTGQSPLVKEEAESDGFLTVLMKELVQNLPAIVQAAAPMFAAATAAPSPQPATVQVDATAPANTTASMASASLPVQAQPPSFFEQSYLHGIGVFVDSIARNAPHDAAISAADYLIKAFPEGAIVQQFLNQDAQTLAQVLASFSPEAAQAVSQPHAIQWIETFLNDFFGEAEEGEAPEAQDALKALSANA